MKGGRRRSEFLLDPQVYRELRIHQIDMDQEQSRLVNRYILEGIQRDRQQRQIPVGA
jgi:hypothetical protein